MSGWGQSPWGDGVWGGDGVLGTLDPPFPLGDTPVIITRYPTARQLEVAEDSQISVAIFDANYNLDTSYTKVYLDGVLVYGGSTGFNADYVGRDTYVAGTSRIVFKRRTGFSYGQTVTLRVEALDTNLNYVSDTWYFTVRNDPTCYTGLTPLPVETALTTPYVKFLSMEPLRQFMFNHVLKDQTAQASAKAARAIYQLAYATELSALQNSFDLVNKNALATRVCEKQSPLIIDRALEKQRDNTTTAIRDLKNSGVLDEAYSHVFHDYLDSTLYIYRVSLVANMVLFAKNYELAAGL